MKEFKILNILLKKIQFFILVTLSATLSLFSAPSSSWYLDELGIKAYSYKVKDDITNNNGRAYSTDSTGVNGGKICSALDFRTNSTSDYAKLDNNSLSGANDFTISVWLKGTSTAGRSLLSGARSGKDNALLMWFSSDTRFSATIENSSASSITFPSIANNQWHHFVWRRIADQSCVFTDGVNRGCSTIRTDTLNITSLILAQEQDSVGGNFDKNQDWEGLVDELLFFRNGLNDSEIKSIYDNQNAGKAWNGATRSCTKPIDYGYSDWHFDEKSWNGTANEIHDEHGGNHGKGYDISSVPGKICTAMDLSKSGTSDYAILGKDALDGIDDFTISIWHKGVSGNNGKSLLSGANSSQYNELIFWFTNETSFRGHLEGHSQAIGNNNINTGNWRHLVWRRTGNESCYFVDNVKQGCKAFDPSTLSISSLILGQEQDTLGGGFDSGQDWEGVVDELLIFRRALSDNDISNIYNNQNAGKNWDGTTRTCPGMPKLNIEKSSIVTHDPINSSNPKRIPGATIRYCFKVDNTGEGKADDLKIEDTLTNDNKENLSYVNSGKITQDISTDCDCASISDTSGAIANDKVTIDIASLDINRRVCAYIELLIE